MSNKSSTSLISLPKGGGAQKGIGEKFSPDLFTGTGNFTVPIALPPGRNGFQPELNLVYSTGSGNSAFGLGWSLSIPGVSRKTSKGIPRYRDYAGKLTDRDTFILSGAEDLVPLSASSESPTRYRPRTEGLFARIDHHHDDNNDYWEVRSKDGLVSFYGTPESSEDDPAVVADPSDRSKIFNWKLSRTEDPFGNRIEYEYERDAGEDGPHHWDQLYLKRIRYVDYDDGGTTKFLVSVTFHYEDRPDPFSDYRPGFEIRKRKRCTRIEVRTHADAEHLVRTYHLVYLDHRPGMTDRLPLNGVSLLSQVKVVGYDGDRTEELPPLEFAYSQFEPNKRDFFPLKGRDLPAQSLGSPDTELVDLFGNGLPDIMEMNGSVRYWRNLGNGQYDLPREMQEAPAGLQLADPGVQLIDADGDGRTDLLVTSNGNNNNNGLSGFFPLRFGGLWDKGSFQKYDLAPSFNLQDPEVKLVDLDGDGVTDAIRSGSRMELFFNDPEEGWSDTRFVERQDLDEFPNVNFSDPRVRWADMSGDGLQDIVLVYDGNIEYWPNLGYGDWGRRIHMRNSPRFPNGYNPSRILVGDVAGDGLADIIYVDNNQVTLWINRSGNAWSDPIEIQGTPRVTDMDAVRLVDMLGTGISGVLWSRDAAMPGRETMLFLDFTGGVKPYLLDKMDNHMGAITRVQYVPSTRFYLDDEKDKKKRWKTPLPFPVQVVACVEVIDQISKGKLTTEYHYHHGYWDGEEREFRGFGRVDQRDTETFERYNESGLDPDSDFKRVQPKFFSPPVEICTWFHQGPVSDEFGEWEETDYSNEYWYGDPQLLKRPGSMTDFLKGLPRRVKQDALRALRGRILRTELYALDGKERRPYTVTEYLHGAREEVPPGPDEEDRLHIFFSHTLAQRTTQWERGNDPMTQFSFADDYDKFGQPRSQIGVAVPRGRDFRQTLPQNETTEPYLATQSISTYVQRDDDQRYIVDRVAHATSYEIKNDGRQGLFDLVDEIKNGLAEKEIIGQTLNFYDLDTAKPDNSAFVGLPFGQIGDFGALVRTEILVLTEDILQKAYEGDRPPYLTTPAPATWPQEYPQEFREQLPDAAGYIYQPGGINSEYITGYYAIADQRRYDFHDNPDDKRGLLLASRDPLNHETRIEYDDYDFLPLSVIDPVGLTTRARYDYRVLQPDQVTDPNGNQSAFGFTPLGLMAYAAVMGKPGEAIGDTRDDPGARLEYDFFAFMNRSQPVSVRTIQRLHHVNEIDVGADERDETIETVEYSDGLGRLVQTRTQAEDLIFGDSVFGDDIGLPADQSSPNLGPAVGQTLLPGFPPRTLVSGWQTFDNKGRVVEQYELFFSAGWEYLARTDAPPELFGAKTKMFYDPAGRGERTINPDGSQRRVVYGTPRDLAIPELFDPNPWEVYTYDENDNAGRTHAGTTAEYEHHWNTPPNTVVDALGRTIVAVERNGPDPATDWYITRSEYDIRGNPVSITDALGREAFRYTYDLLDNSLRIDSIDAGVREIVLDVAGNEIERRDAKGALILQAYDVLNRPARLWARDDQASSVTLRERLEYGDGSDPEQDDNERDNNRLANRLGRLYRHYEEAGLLTFEDYDFKGNIIEKTRQVISDSAILSVFDPPPPDWQIPAFRVNWQPPDNATLLDHAAGLLDPAEYRTSLSYDALNRVRTMIYPRDVDGERKVLRPQYNRAGALERVELGGATYVQHIAYNAKGQRMLTAYGNGFMTRYAYDSKTFRLLRLRSERFSTPAVQTYQPLGQPLQDFGYQYDLVGNITDIQDRTPKSGIPNTMLGTDALDRSFDYDAIYRLLSATGRECDRPPEGPPWRDQPRCTDLTLTRGYTEQYLYDPVGNLTQLKHQNDAGGFVRTYSTQTDNNRLVSMSLGNTDYDYRYDANGNMVQETLSRHFEWDHSDRMKVYRTQIGDAEPSVHAHYLYDSGGQRVKKLIRNQGGQIEETIYIDGVFEHHRLVEASTQQENNTLHIMDDQSRVVMFRVGDPFPEDSSPAISFHLGDHLGSSNVVIDQSGGWINHEEYMPYGETSFGSFARKRYRFTSKERDEESGLFYHGARFYSPCLARWLSADPLRLTNRLLGLDSSGLFIYGSDNPIKNWDPTGLQDVDGVEAAKNLRRSQLNAIHTVQDASAPVADVVVGLHPGVALYETVAGETAILGKPVPLWERILNVVPFVGKVAAAPKVVNKAARVTDTATDVKQISKTSKFTKKDILEDIVEAQRGWWGDKIDDLQESLDSVTTSVKRRIYRTRHSEALGRALEASGRTRPPGHQAHHITAVNDVRAKRALELLEEADIGLNEAVNGVWLPSSSWDTVAESWVRHASIHTTTYYEYVTKRLKSVPRELRRDKLAKIGSEIEEEAINFHALVPPKK